jgi:adenylate cyclase
MTMGGGRWWRRRLLLLAAVALGSASIAIALWATDTLEGPELDLLDARFEIRGESDPPRDLVVVAIDDRTFDELRESWPFPRGLHAKVVDILTQAGAAVIAYDVQFTEPTEREQDEALARAIARAQSVVLATTEVDPEGGTNVLGGEEVLERIDARAANANLAPDQDGVIRRVPHSIQGLEGFAVAIAEELGDPLASKFQGDSALIDYAGPPGTVETISLSSVLQRRFPNQLFANKGVIVGAAAPSLQDVHPTSISGDRLMPGAEVQANAAASILGGLPLDEAPGWVDVLTIILLAAVPPLASVRLRPLIFTLVGLGAGLLFAIAAQLAFNTGLVLEVIYPLVALGLSIVGTLAVNYFTATLERERVRDIFSRFVPEAVVDDVLKDAGEDLRLGGVERECTLMFVDLRGFTSFSESLSPERVIEVVNVYLGEMSGAILENGGTLIAYLGDGIMALFGAPIEDEDHADKALATAREMMGPRLERFNAWLGEQGLGDGLRMGIGLNTGKVMVGNVGSSQRLEYTAIGDTTNTASRLEGLTKGSGHMLLIAESTKDALHSEPADLVFVDEFVVRGREAKLRAWSVPDPEPAEQAATARDAPAGA